jgi:WD40-like Beta Propeller Repeat
MGLFRLALVTQLDVLEDLPRAHEVHERGALIDDDCDLDRAAPGRCQGLTALGGLRGHCAHGNCDQGQCGSHEEAPATYPGVIQVASWSPDGRTLAYQTWTGKGEADIVALDVASGQFHRVSRREGAYLDETPAWAPDGRLLFQSTRSASFEVYVMEPDGTHVRLLTP